ncbi:MAG: fatty acid desaturase [Limisphaerales bacterium]|jgi:fatty acid desaturase
MESEPAGTKHPLTEVELRQVTAKSDLRGLWVLLCQWSLLLGIFAVVAIWPNPATIVAGIVLLGGRQLGFFIITHEAGHRTLFKSPTLNRWVSTWLTSPMDFSNGQAYMREHLIHHRAMGGEADPDLANYVEYPIERSRLRRKLTRDLTGQTGWRNLSAKLVQLGALSSLNGEDRQALLRGVAWHAVMLTVFTAIGAPWLILLWLGAQIFAYPAIIRLRQIAEHAAVVDLQSADVRFNTRTTLSSFWMRLVLCPHGVNYHVEHHLLASVPIYKLKHLHQLLTAQGYFDSAPVTEGYGRVLREVTVPI